MAELFDRDRSVIQRHIKNIFKEDELEQNSTCAKFAQVQNEGNRSVERIFDYYNLDMIISVGYRVKSQRGIAFRKWATSILKEYIVQGYAVNDKRLKVLNKVIEIQSSIIADVLELDSWERKKQRCFRRYHRLRLSNGIRRRYISIHSRKSGKSPLFHSQRPSFY